SGTAGPALGEGPAGGCTAISQTFPSWHAECLPVTEGFVMPSAIEEHGVIGNLRTVALVATNGAIDWCCLPNFDSPSVFGALLDDARGGHFQISPTVDKLRTRQTYLPDTNILITRFLHAEALGAKVAAPEIEEWLQRTIAYWRRWLAHSRYVGRWREMVHRSALVLKLLTFEPTGALIAAPTTSLPERIGGGRNWDYRYTWIRDASFTLYALLRIGFTEEAGAFTGWLARRSEGTQARGGPK